MHMIFYRLLENTEWVMPQHSNKLERSSWKFDRESLSRFCKCQNELLIGVSICILLWFYFKSLVLSIWSTGTTVLFPRMNRDLMWTQISCLSWFGVISKTQQVSLSSTVCPALIPQWALPDGLPDLDQPLRHTHQHQQTSELHRSQPNYIDCSD